MGSFTQDSRSGLLAELLDADRVDLAAVGRAAQDGLPEVKGLRAQVWKLCLGYVPPTLLERKRHLARKREEYQFFVKAMCRALFIYAKLNPGIKYVQGMNELFAPMYYVFATDPDQETASQAEADAFFCFVELMAGCRDLFCAQLDDSAGGIRATLSTLGSALRAVDPALATHVLDTNGVAPHFFAFRWITLLLTQEFAFPDALRIWDAIVTARARDRGHALLCICLAMVVLAREELFQGDFAANMKLLQHYPPTDVRAILARAREHDITSAC